MHTTHVDLSLDIRQQVIAILNKRLADAVDLSIQVKLAHWNVRGKHFIALHELFDKVVDSVKNSSDEIAERISQLGGVVTGNIQDVVKNTSLGAFPSDISKGEDIVGALVQGISTFANNCRKDIDNTDKLGDAVTADLLTAITRETDKYLWFVEAHQQ